MTKRYAFGLAAMALAGAVIGGCSSNSVGFNPGNGGGGNNPTPPPTAATFQQIELLSRPAVKEVFEAFADHDKTNRSEPYADPVLQGMILSFSEMFRSTQTSTALQSILYPNVMKADLSQNTTTASYLGYETGGATGSKFGGRALDDDVVDISLGALFGNTLSALGVVPDDMKEVPCLTTDNVPYDKNNTQTFPYVQSPV
jgi:hypothetical protein